MFMTIESKALQSYQLGTFSVFTIFTTKTITTTMMAKFNIRIHGYKYHINVKSTNLECIMRNNNNFTIVTEVSFLFIFHLVNEKTF